MLHHDQRPKVTIEEILQLKRTERPSEEFWQTFDRELRQKQLTALMEKRSWWQELPLIFMRRAYLPVGATAILAFTLVSVKFYSPSQVAQLDGSMVLAQTGASAADSAHVNSSAVSDPVSSPLLNRSEQAAQHIENTVIETVAVAEVPAGASRIEVLPLLSASQPAETPSARSIAANLARLEQSEPELINSVLGSRLSPTSTRAQNVSAQVAELSSVPTGASTRSRLLAQYSGRELEPEPAAPAIVRERHARRLADSELNDRITRVGLRGDQVSLRF